MQKIKIAAVIVGFIMAGTLQAQIGCLRLARLVGGALVRRQVSQVSQVSRGQLLSKIPTAAQRVPEALKNLAALQQAVQDYQKRTGDCGATPVIELFAEQECALRTTFFPVT